MSAVTISISGVKEVSKKLEQLYTQKQRNLVEAVEITQALITNDAKSIVPVKTAFLQSTIQPGKVIVQGSVVDGFIEATANYASYVEFGTSRQRAQPYMVPSIMKNRAEFARRIKAAVKA